MATKTSERRLPGTLDELIGAEIVARYYTAPWGHHLGVYADGEIMVGEDVGREIAPAERPVATVKCPGIGNIDMAFWRAGWDCNHLSDVDVVRGCCEDGDVEDERQELVRRIREAMAD